MATDPALVAAAYAELQTHCPPGMMIKAYWRVTRFSNDRSYPIRSAGGLALVMQGLARGRCAPPGFYIVPQVNPKDDHVAPYNELFGLD